jgi:hypothetical protein
MKKSILIAAAVMLAAVSHGQMFAQRFGATAAAFTPTSIPGCTVWMDATVSSSITLRGTNVASWTSLAAGGMVYSQTNETLQPFYDGTTINSKPVVRFPIPYCNLFAASTNSFHTVFVVTRVTSYAALRGVFGRLNLDLGVREALSSGLWRHDPGTAADYSYGGAFYVNGSNTVAYTVNDPHIISVVPSSTRSFVWTIGGYYPAERNFVGHIGEFIAYSGALTDAQRKQVESYLGAKWGISVAP